MQVCATVRLEFGKAAECQSWCNQMREAFPDDLMQFCNHAQCAGCDFCGSAAG